MLPKHRDFSKSSTYGVESLETTISSLAHDSDESEEKVRRARQNWKKHLRQQTPTRAEEDLPESTSPSLKSSGDVSGNVSPSHQRRSSQATISRPFTPLSFGSPAPASVMSSPNSRRNSDAGSYMDDIASQAIVSSGDEDRDVGSELIDSGSAPQLVMPSIKMPSRRPFTERGKNMGRLKVLIAGDSGMYPAITPRFQTDSSQVLAKPPSSKPLSKLARILSMSTPYLRHPRYRRRSGRVQGQNRGVEVRIYNPRHKSLKFMQARGHIQLGFPI
jgi:hypothetical protein